MVTYRRLVREPSVDRPSRALEPLGPRDPNESRTESWDSLRDTWQRIVDEQPIPPRHEQRDFRPPVAVRATIRWERDGTEELDTIATAWHGRTVLILIEDPRRQTIGVWLPVGAVERVQSAPPTEPDTAPRP